MSTERLRAVFVGVGGRGRVHLDAWADHPRLAVAGLVDVDERFLADARAVTGLPTAACHRSLTAALPALPAEVVVVVTPAQSHGPVVREALAAGKHVMVEKPLTCDLAEAQELVRLAEQANLKLMVTQQMRYLPVERTLRRLLAEETYGRPGFGHYVHYKARGSAYNPSDHMQLWQQSVHELDALLAIVDRPVERVQAREFQPVWGDWPSESTVAAIIEFTGGPVISYLSSSDARAFRLECRIECERGALVHRATRLGGDGTLVVATRDGEKPVPLDPGLANRESSRGMADKFAAYILDGVEPEISGRRNLATLSLCDAILRSTQSSGGRPSQ